MVDPYPQCVGKLEIVKPKPVVGFLCGTLPILTDFPIPQSALLPSSSTSQTIGAPRYQMLPTETDLNTLPLLPNSSDNVFPASAATDANTTEVPHWESGYNRQNLSRKCEALAVSGLTEYGDEIDVVAPTDILKQIFKIPYSKGQLSIAVHRVGDTLILNTGPDVEEGDKILQRQNNQSKGSDPSIFLNFAMHSVRAEACDCPPTHKPSSERSSNSTILPGHFDSREASFVSSTNSHSSKSTFLDESVSGRRKTAQAHHEKYFWGTKQKKQTTNKKPEPVKRTSEVGEKPRCTVQDSDKLKKVGNNGFLRVLFWQFHNFRMLLGSDLLIFSNEKYVAVSLHLWDVARQVTPLTWLEAWLDNVMASVPEVAICYHDNGVVRGYELLKTDDIFLKGISEDGTPAFHPQVVQQNGLSVLRFLQDNCKQNPGAYWLYKSAGEDVIQLFDLSIIPKNHSNDDHDKGCSSLPSLMHRGRKDSMFLLGTLLYRVAHRLSLSKAPDNRVKCAKFFKKCLDFLREQDHLVVRAYAHEQFARLILNCYEELELTSESFLIESEVTVTDLEEESSECSLGMFALSGQDMVSSQASAGSTSIKDRTTFLSSGPEASCLKFEADSCNISSAAEATGLTTLMATSKVHDSSEMSQISEAAHVARNVGEISSKLAAVHHISQAIKSLRLKRQLQNAQGDLVDQGYIIPDRSTSNNNFNLCACGDTDCIEVCDIRQWLTKSKLDHKMWNLVLLLGESYLVLAEAYKEDRQLDQALKVLELACLIYGSMPQHLKDKQFISSMVSGSSQQSVNDGTEVNAKIEDVKGLGANYFAEGHSANQLSHTYLFWVKAWLLVGDVYVEYYREMGEGNLVQAEKKTSDSELRMSNEVVKEVKRLKKKLGHYKPNCSSCSLINCSCQSDRASSNNSASSSTGVASSSYTRKQSRKSTMKKSPHSLLERTLDSYNTSKLRCADRSEVEHLQHVASSEINAGIEYNSNGRSAGANMLGRGTSTAVESNLEESPVSADNVGKENFLKNHTSSFSKDSAGFETSAKVVTDLKCGGIFKFLEAPKFANAEDNLSAAISCYDASRKAIGDSSVDSAEFYSVVKKKGWVCNELGRYRLGAGNLSGAEIAFADAIVTFKDVSDHTNIILINCNLGHGRRALAEELVAKMGDIPLNAYKQAMKTSKLQYFESLRYYGAAKMELSSAGDQADSLLHNEVYTQLAHTYLRLGMLLARENTQTEGNERAYAENFDDMSASDAFREALSTYESLGDLRKQEAAFAHFQLACYHRDTCLKFLNLDQKRVIISNGENSRQKAKWYASLAEKHWQKSIAFYGPKTHTVMYLDILMELSAISMSLWKTFHSNTMLEAALINLLKGRHVVEEDDGDLDCDLDVGKKFWDQLLSLLKTMLSSTLSGSKAGASFSPNRAGDSGKLKEMYRMALKSKTFCQLYVLHEMWVS